MIVVHTGVRPPPSFDLTNGGSTVVQVLHHDETKGSSESGPCPCVDLCTFISDRSGPQVDEKDVRRDVRVFHI